MWFYYNGFSGLHGLSVPADPVAGGICLAKLRLDGFVSLEAGKDEGSLLAKPLVVTGEHLLINADIPQGKIRVEIVDESGNAIPGFSARSASRSRGTKSRER